MLKAKWISLWAFGFRLETVVDSSFVPEIDEELEQELQTAGLANAETSPTEGVQRDSSGTNQPSICWNPSLTLLFARLLCYEVLAIASVLIEKYHFFPWKLGRDAREFWKEKYLDCRRHPYVLIDPSSPMGIEVQIWPRHKPIVNPNTKEDAEDSHRRDLLQHLRTVEAELTAQRWIELYDAMAQGVPSILETNQTRSSED